MVKKVQIFLEGSGPGRTQQALYRAAFSKLCKKMGFIEKRPSFFACGIHNQAYKDFVNALKRDHQALSILLVDSEDSVKNLSKDPNSNMAWDHLKIRDNWDKPADALPYQALIMATSMETWIATDREALKAFFGKDLQESALPTLPTIESQLRKDILNKLEHSTRNCSKKYQKGDISFKILGSLDPTILHQHLTQFQRLKAALDIVLSP